MSRTTIRRPPDLKARVAAAAKRRSNFHDVADKRYSRIATTGKTIPWSEMRTYLDKRIAGKKAPRPVAKKLAR